MTPRKRSSGRRRPSDLLFQRLADASPLMVWQADARGRCTFANRCWLAFTGCTLASNRGLGWTARIHPEDRHAHLAAYRAAVDRGHPFTLEYRCQRADGQTRWISDSVLPRLDARGRAIGYVGSRVDITERKEGTGALVDAEARHEAMRRSQDQLRSLAGKLHAAREEERTHLARELHDDLGQTLTSLKLELLRLVKTLDRAQFKPATLDRIQSLIGLTEISLETTRRLATDLRPPALDHLGLAEAIRFEASVVQARTGIRCRSVVRASEPQLLADQATGVFRIFQEAITNVIRHAEASAVRITLDEAGRTFVLSVKDNGRGITLNEVSDPVSIGLVGMRERARLLGGTLDISGKKGKGTTVVLRMPTSAHQHTSMSHDAHSAR